MLVARVLLIVTYKNMYKPNKSNYGFTCMESRNKNNVGLSEEHSFTVNNNNNGLRIHADFASQDTEYANLLWMALNSGLCRINTRLTSSDILVEKNKHRIAKFSGSFSVSCNAILRLFSCCGYTIALVSPVWCSAALFTLNIELIRNMKPL